ncbi:hypothetical protein FRB94_014150 [Tulasnella sp. JGI-2019a]|nr:hypothetical protein FRB93_008425 [Tulasnella sp. JGI-2019a]KAG9007632.1 hypothetical protein FRB94_014150 [Tulasnella sp. JGI-2019a]KAG9033090.1 hypothetical protein FRB95_000594 [Tulasnella sp. JGI-2019a]
MPQQQQQQPNRPQCGPSAALPQPQTCSPSAMQSQSNSNGIQQQKKQPQEGQGGLVQQRAQLQQQEPQSPGWEYFFWSVFLQWSHEESLPLEKPMIEDKDVNLAKLFLLTGGAGGYDQANATGMWEVIGAEIGFAISDGQGRYFPMPHIAEQLPGIYERSLLRFEKYWHHRFRQQDPTGPIPLPEHLQHIHPHMQNLLNKDANAFEQWHHYQQQQQGQQQTMPVIVQKITAASQKLTVLQRTVAAQQQLQQDMKGAETPVTASHDDPAREMSQEEVRGSEVVARDHIDPSTSSIPRATSPATGSPAGSSRKRSAEFDPAGNPPRWAGRLRSRGNVPP